MCGIAGLAGFSPESELRGQLGEMLAALEHRGPDDLGTHCRSGVAIGIRRLSILDLEGGRQPFFSEDESVAVVCNGEIYNFRALRRELEGRGEKFRTGCDAEVLPHAYRHFGIDGMLSRVDGMFAIAIYDADTRTLHLCRDRFGEKPLFYRRGGASLAFSSELPALRTLPGFDTTIDRGSLRQFLAVHYVSGARTIYDRVKRVPAGCRVSYAVDDARLSEPVDWAPADPSCGQQRFSASETVAAQTLERLAGAVTSRLVADVPVGVFLSGGIDSAAIAALVGNAGSELRTFSIGFEDAELDESEHAERVARHLGATHQCFRFDLRACLDVLDPALRACGEPVGDPAMLPVYLLAREARRSVKVVLSGEGGDEVFGGYGYYPDVTTRISRILRVAGRRSAVGERFFREPGALTPSGFPLLTNFAQRDELTDGEGSEEDEWTLRVSARAARCKDGLASAQRVDLETWLPDDLLVKLDRMTMAASLEARAPFLAPSVADWGLGLWAGWKQRAGTSKWILRRAIAQKLPPSIVWRRKQGFVLPIGRWLAGPLKERLLDELRSERGDGLNGRAAARLAEADLAQGVTRSRLLFALLAYRVWSSRDQSG